MKKILLSSVALLGLTAGAMAADLPSRRAPAPYVAVPVFTWTGFYVGVNAGYGFTDNGIGNNAFGSFNNLTAVNANGGRTALGVPTIAFGNVGGGNRDGFVGGGQIGYNYQFGQFVIGLEADAQYADLGGRPTRFGALDFGTFAPNPNVGLTRVPPGLGNVAFFNNNGLFNSANSSEFFGTVRGRVGYAIDRLLIFGTGGLAYTVGGNNNGGFGTFNNGAAVPAAFFISPAAATAGAAVTGGFVGRRNTNDDIGWTVGGGVEYAFTPNITGKIEGLYVNFGNGGNNTLAGGTVVGVTNTGAAVVSGAGRTRARDLDFSLVRAGLNYKFNWY